MRTVTISFRYEDPTNLSIEVERVVVLGNTAFDREDVENVARKAIDSLFKDGPGR